MTPAVHGWLGTLESGEGEREVSREISDWGHLCPSRPLSPPA